MLNLEQVRQFLYYEARLLDDRQWDEWLSCYSPQVVYWMPAWGDDDQLTRDPQKEISLIYLRHGERPLLMLAGGTGLAPLLSMLHTLQTQGSQRPVMLLYGVTRDCDLVKTDALDTFTQQLTGYRWLPVVADENSTCPQRGFVTDHLDDAMLNNGDVDIYLCGPPPMVNAVATALRDRGITPAGFWYEKFIASQSAAA